MWTVHFLTFHQPHDFRSSGSMGWPSKGTGLSNTFKNSTIQALKTFWSNKSFGISSWINLNNKYTIGIIAHVNSENLSGGKQRNRWESEKTYIYRGPEYFTDKLDQICYFKWWIINLDKPVKYVEKVGKCLLNNAINGGPLLIWLEPDKRKWDGFQKKHTALDYCNIADGSCDPRTIEM